MTWRAAVHIPYESLHSSYPNYSVYQADLAFTAPGTTTMATICTNVPTTSCPMLVRNEAPAQYSAASYAAVAQGSAVAGPWNGATLNVAPDMNGWMQQGQSNQWLGISDDSHAGLVNYDLPLFIFEMFIPPSPSRVLNVASGTVFSTMIPTLQAAAIPENSDDSSAYRKYDYQITTGPSPGTGQIISSGELVQCRSDGVNCSNTAQTPPQDCVQGSPCPFVPSFTVPMGELSEGVTYHAWVLTNWSPDFGQYPEVSPPASWGVSFTVKLGLGSGGPSPTDRVGSVPGQSSTPASGAPSPGLPGSAVTVNMVDGNMSLAVGTPKEATVGGGLALGFAYNSLSAVAQGTPQGLSGVYYNDTDLGDASADPGHANASDVEVAARVDPSVEFDWGQGTLGVAAQNPAEAYTVWTGAITFPNTDTWELGDVSSDGVDIYLNNQTTPTVADWGPHAAQTSPYISGASITPTRIGSGQVNAVPIQIDWHHSSVNPAVVEIFAEDLTVSSQQGGPVIYQIPSSWFTHAVGTLPAGWTLNASAGQASWVGLADRGASVTVYGPDGSGYEFVNAGAGRYLAPSEDPTAELTVDAGGYFLLDDPASGLIYRFNPSGSLASIRSASDDLSAAALSYTYSGSPAMLRQITDPVSNDPSVGNRVTKLVYGGDTSPACPAAPGWSPPPAGMLCQVDFWDGTSTSLYYNSSAELGAVVDPGSVTYVFAYDSLGRMTLEEDPLAVAVVDTGTLRSSDCPQSYPEGCLTEISYDSAGRAQTVISPAPNTGGTVANGGRAERAYCYGDQKAAITVTNGTVAVSCTAPAADTTALAVAGLAPSVGYAEQLSYDARNRITATRDSSGLATRYLWNSADQLVATVSPEGVETSASYDSGGRPTASYGPAPAASFRADGQPVSGQSVATATTSYDGGLSGLAAAWYSNPTLSGSPVFHSTVPASDSWASGSSPSAGSANPALVPTGGYSGRLTGTLTVASPQRVSYSGDGGSVSVDGHQVIDQTGGPYPGAVRADAPSNWWRLGEGAGATIASDSAGSDAGAYNSGVSPGQPAAYLADGDSLSAGFDGVTATVTMPPQSQYQFANTQPFSLEAWIKTTNTSAAGQIVVSTIAATSPYPGFELGTVSGMPYVWLINNASSNLIGLESATSVADGNWHDVLVSYSGSSKASGVTIYVDGTATATTVWDDSLSASLADPTTSLTIGSRAGYHPFSGSIADVSIYPNTALSAARAAAHHSAAGLTSTTTSGPVVYSTPYPEAVDADSPQAYWRLNDTAGTTATDSWGSENGTYSNVALGQTGPLLGDTSTAGGFNGSTSNVALPGDPVNLSEPVSVDAWFETASDGVILSAQNSALGATPSLYDPIVYVGTDYKLHGGLYSGRCSVATITTSVAVNDSKWHHVAFVSTGTSQTLYLDGSSVGTDNCPSDPQILSSAFIGDGYTHLWPATTGTNMDFNGSISDLAVYRSALEPDRVLAHYRAGAFGPYPSAVGSATPESLWRLGEGSLSSPASDTFGPNPGTYLAADTNGAYPVVLNQPGPLTGDPTTSATFNTAACSGPNYSATCGSVKIPDSSSLQFSNTQPFSVEAWISTKGGQVIIASKMANSAPYQGWELGIDGNGHPYFLLVNTWATNALDVGSNTWVSDGHWHHLVVTYSGSSNASGVSFYVDGKATTTTTYYNSLSATSASSAPLYLGSRADAYDFFVGGLADIAVYGQALSPDAVAGNYLAAQTAPAPGPYADIHRVSVDDQQYIAGGGYTVAATGATFDPDYGLVTSAVDADGKTADTGYSDQTGIGPEFGLATSQTQDPSGLALKTVTGYEAPGAGRYLRVVSKTLPAGNQTTYVNYCGYATDPTCASPEQPGAWASACGVSAGASQWGLVAEKTEPAPASGAGDALVEQYLYDPTGRQVGVRVGTVNTVGGNGWDCSSYDSYGRLDQVDVAGGSTGEAIGYDSNGRQASQSITTQAGGYSGGSAQTFSPAGRVATQQVYTNGALAGPAGVVYDGAGRVVQDFLPGVTYSYSYAATSGCPAGNAGLDTNRSTLTVTQGSTSTATGYCYDHADRLVSTSAVPAGQVVYDGHANMTVEGGETFGYDSSDQLVSDDAAGYLTSYERDPLGRPAQITSYTKITAGSTATAVTAAGSSVTVSSPAGTGVGDILVAAVTSSAQSGASSPAGWALVASTQNGAGVTWVYSSGTCRCRSRR